ncbi:MAG: ROK family protein [Candidatus Omnitrophota bacterium]|jgi:glucokinase
MKHKYFIAIDLGGTNIKAAVLDEKFSILKKITLPTPAASGRKAVVAVLVSAAKALTKELSLSLKDISGVGIGVPGPVDFEKQIVHFLPNIPGWKRVPLSALFTAACGISCVVDNDAKLMALAEYERGAAKGSRNAICLTLGTGVGAGLILGGRLYRGSDNAAGEVGHLPLNEDGPLCSCGGRACLERYVGNNTLLKEARAALGASVTLEQASALAARGDTRALAFWRKAAERLGIAFAGLSNVLNPDMIVIGGGVSGAGRPLFDGIKETLRRRAMPVQGRRVKVLKAALGNDAGLIGAALAAERA